MQPKYYGAAANYNNRPSGSMSNARKLLTLLGLFFGLIILLVVAMSILSAISKGPQDEYSRLIARLDKLTALTQKQQAAIHNNDLRRINSTASLLLSGDLGALNRRLVPVFGIESVPENIAALEADTTTEPKLKEASLVGAFDTAFLSILRDQIAATAALSQTVNASISDERTKAAIAKLLEDLGAIDRQLTEIKL